MVGLRRKSFREAFGGAELHDPFITLHFHTQLAPVAIPRFPASAMDNLSRLVREIAQKEIELADLRSQLAIAESENRIEGEALQWKWPLGADEYERYSRQMIVPNMGLNGKCMVKIF